MHQGNAVLIEADIAKMAVAKKLLIDKYAAEIKFYEVRHKFRLTQIEAMMEFETIKKQAAKEKVSLTKAALLDLFSKKANITKYIYQC